MTINVGRADQIIRITAGVAIIALGFYAKSFIGLIGLVPLFTGFVRHCPLYLFLKVDTCKKQ